MDFNLTDGQQMLRESAARFVRDVETIFLDLARSDPRRLRTLVLLAIACYALMVLEIWLVFWAIGQPIGVTEGLAVETFARLASIASAAIPGNIGVLEASNAAVVAALGLAGGGALALARRIRALLWAAAGLAVYPRVQERRQ